MENWLRKRQRACLETDCGMIELRVCSGTEIFAASLKENDV
jgi:hypothetical protein